MHHTIQALVDGDAQILEWYKLGVEKWREVLSSGIDPLDSAALAAEARKVQLWFEQKCGPSDDRWVGQEIMVVTALNHYHHRQNMFRDTLKPARALYRGLISSGCSSEVKTFAKRLAAFLHEELTEE